MMKTANVVCKTMKLKRERAAKQEPLKFHFDLFKTFACFPELTFTTLGYRLQNGIKQIEKKEKRGKEKKERGASGRSNHHLPHSAIVTKNKNFIIIVNFQDKKFD